MLHPNTELVKINDNVGRGIRATAPIPRGTFVWIRDDLDQTLSPERVAAMDETLRKVLRTWGFVDNAGNYVLCWDEGRYVNHSCDNNLLSPGFGLEVAIRDIEAGEELTDDYTTLNLEEPFACACERPGCRGTIEPSDCLRLAEQWDLSTTAALRHCLDVPQALWHLVRDKARLKKTIQRLLREPDFELRHFRRLYAKAQVKGR